MKRDLITNAKRIVIKIGSSSLTGSAGSGLDASAVDRLVDVVSDARIHPEAIANELNSSQILNVVTAAQKVMQRALKAGGTSFDELYINVNGESGYFERSLAVYGREGEPCRRCGGEISRIAFANRSSRFCPACQTR